MKKYINMNDLDQIIHKTAMAIEDGKKQIFEIAEKSRQEYLAYESELIEVKSRLSLVINAVDKLDIRYQLARNIIKTINEHFTEFSEKDIKDAYELSEQTLLELSAKRHEEKELSERRNELERLIKNSREVITKSELLEMKVSVALEYLNSSIVEQLEDIQAKKDIGVRILEAQENEKKRISRDIHDGPAQSIANLVLKSEYAYKIIDTSPRKAKKELATLQEEARDTLKDIRRIIYDLMPMSLDDLGLIPTIKKMVSTFKTNTGIDVSMQLKDQGGIESNMINLMVFRVVQEVFNNIAKHSRCDKVIFQLSIDSDQIDVDISDNGVGFDASKQTREGRGFGLYNLKERVEMVNGIIDIQSRVNQGTQVKISIPNI